MCGGLEDDKVITHFVKKMPNTGERYTLVVTPEEATHDFIFNRMQTHSDFVSAIEKEMHSTLVYDKIDVVAVKVLFLKSI